MYWLLSDTRNAATPLNVSHFSIEREPFLDWASVVTPLNVRIEAENVIEEAENVIEEAENVIEEDENEIEEAENVIEEAENVIEIPRSKGCIWDLFFRGMQCWNTMVTISWSMKLLNIKDT